MSPHAIVIVADDAAGIWPPELDEPCNMPTGWGRLCMLRGDHKDSCLPVPHRIFCHGGAE